MNAIIKLLATGLGAGYMPKAPGTFGSLVGLTLVYVLRPLPFFYYFIFVVAFSLASIWISGRAEKLFGEKDAQQIVIDEIAGILVTFILVPFIPITVVAGFLLFRLFDIWKPYPISRMQEWEGGLGIVVDDLAAGLYANLSLQFGLSVWFAVAAA